VERLASSLGYDNVFAVSSSGRSGGLAIFWNNDSRVEVFRFSRYHIDAKVLGIGSDPWRLTCVYGEAQTSERYKTWYTMKGIKAENDLPWLCLGDFNEVLRQEEHDGIGQRTQAQIEGFRDAIDVCGLRDLGYTGRRWTFEKKVVGGSFTRVRLDRFLAAPAWVDIFPSSVVKHLISATSDHGPILLEYDDSVRRLVPSKTPFHYELMWKSHSDLRTKVETCWQEYGPSSSAEALHEKLCSLAGTLGAWGKETFGSVKKEIRKLENDTPQHTRQIGTITR
jgi:hypothetical protein